MGFCSKILQIPYISPYRGPTAKARPQRKTKENKENQSRKRTKDNFEDFQSVVFLEFDTPNQFDTLINSRVIPYPSAVVGSSEGRNHVYWKLSEPIPKRKQEELMANLARSVGADTAATDVSRVLRLPTFCNKKPERNNYQCQLVYPNKAEDPQIETSFDELVISMVESDLRNVDKFGY